MSSWVRITDGTGDTHRYFNLRFAKRLNVVPTIADSTKFTITIDTETNNLDETLQTGLWTSVADANEALRLLVQGMDMSARVN